MKMTFPRLAALTVAAFSLNSYAGDDSKKAVVPMEQPAPVSRWSVTAGATVSSIKTTFHADPAFVTLAGDAPGGVYNGTAPVNYLNGVVGASGPNNPAANLTSASGGILTTPSGLFALRLPSFLTFNGETFGLGSDSNTETSVGPYVKLAYDAFDFGTNNTAHLSPFFQYTFTTAFDSGDVPAFGTVNSVTYETPAAGLVNYVTPTPVTSTSATVLAGGIHSSMNIYMHTFTLGFDLTKDLTNRVHLIISTGPTLNLFDATLTSSTGGFTSTPWARTSDTKLRFGWVGQLGIAVDLGPSRRWFIEADGNYHWVTPFNITTPISDAKVQASSWGGQLGLGARF